MSQEFYVVVNQVLVFAILMLIGFIMAKAKVMTAVICTQKTGHIE